MPSGRPPITRLKGLIMSSITANLTAIPNGTVVDLEAKCNLTWMRARGINAITDTCWWGELLMEEPRFVRSGIYRRTHDRFDGSNNWSTVPPLALARNPRPAFLNGDWVILPPAAPVSSWGGRFPVCVWAAGSHDKQYVLTDTDGLVGHQIVNGWRLFDNSPGTGIRVVAAPPALAVTNLPGEVDGVEMGLWFAGQPAPIEADFYFWYRSGTNFSWALKSLDGSVSGVNYDSAAHGPLAANQLYRLQGTFPTCSDVFALGLTADFDNVTNTPAKVTFSCVTMRTVSA